MNDVVATVLILLISYLGLVFCTFMMDMEKQHGSLTKWEVVWNVMAYPGMIAIVAFFGIYLWVSETWLKFFSRTPK